MIRRTVLAWAAALGSASVIGCQQQAEQNTGGSTAGSGQKADIKTVAASLQVKTGAMIDAINSKNDANIKRAKDDLEKEVDKAEDVVKSETGTAANQVNSALLNIRAAVLSNDVARLERAKQLLQQASA